MKWIVVTTLLVSRMANTCFDESGWPLIIGNDDGPTHIADLSYDVPTDTLIVCGQTQSRKMNLLDDVNGPTVATI